MSPEATPAGMKINSVRLFSRVAVRRVNSKLADFEQIRKYRVLERDFSIDAGELTATLKVRRARALENFQGDIEGLYAVRE